MSPSGVLASPASVLDLPTPAERGRVGSKLPTPLESLSPNTTVGQFSYAPATQTTIVTTTTTTTTSFPPLVLKAPRHLSQLDPKRYPLASSPTPQILKNVRFDFAGTPTYFRESENASQTLCEVSRHSPARRVTPAPPTADASAGDGLIHLARHTDAGTCQLHRENACLTASDGVLQTVSKFAPQYDTPQSGTSSARTPSAKYASGRAFARPLTRSKKRPASPVSISEAAELAQLQRRDQKRREFREISQTAVPTLADLSRRCRKNSSQRSDASTLKLSIGSSEGASQVPQVPATRHHALHPLAETHDHEGTPTPLSPHSAPSKNASFAARDGVPDFLRDETQDTPRMMGQEHEQDQGQDHRHGNEHERASEPGIETAVNLAAATPPIADTDLQPLEPSTASETLLNRPSLPSHLNLSVIQDASLPSPSLSPVTAALSHANAGDYFGADADDDIESSFELPPPEDGRRMGEYRVSKPTTPRGSQDALFALRPPSEADFSNRQLPSPTLMEIPTMLDSFDAMPAEMQTYLMYQFLRRCSKPTLQFVAEVVNPALKCDFLTLLPLELSLNILRSLDFRSLCRAAQVSRKWRQIVDSDERAWKELFDQDNFVLAEGELQRAIREGWGWQHPHGVNACERDLNATTATRPDGGDTASALMMTRSGSALSRGSVATDEADPEHLTYSTPQSGRPKRKAAAKYASRKQPRRRERPRTQADDAGADGFLTQLSVAEGPYAAATAAAAAVPNPAVGLSSLKNLHLHKSLYARHYAIRKHWMMADTNPQHLAFRAHDRHVVTCLQFDTDKILTGSDDTNINVYDTKTGALRTRLEGHEGGVWALQYEGNVLVSGSTDRSVRVWDIEKGLCTQVFQGHTSTVRCLQILMPTQVGEAIDGRPIMAPKQPLIITGSRDASLRVWKLPQPGDKSFFQAGPAPNDTDCPYFVRTLAGHLHSVRAIAAHADTLVSGSYDCTVRVWKISTGETVHRLHGHAQKVYSVVLDHERNRCISGSMDNLVKVWSLETGAVLYSLEGHTSLVGLLDLSHDRLVSAAADSTLRIWDPETGQCKSVLSAHTGAITCFQHDGEKVISGSDRTLKMWNVRTGEYVRDLLTDLSGVWQVKFNGRRCVAAVQRENLTYIEVSLSGKGCFEMMANGEW
ncbi:MAG: SCF ubiquitin ligase complex subunit cdc4 [Thelocarpon superellum]|nr:MAG: SCF ubiquitin ligase complex subunit cdc4 [Thelocarpon superellum]